MRWLFRSAGAVGRGGGSVRDPCGVGGERDRRLAAVFESLAGKGSDAVEQPIAQATIGCPVDSHE